MPKPTKPRPMIAANPGLSGANPATTRPDGKRGAPPGNQRAVKHGWYTAAAKEARWQAWQALLRSSTDQSWLPPDRGQVAAGPPPVGGGETLENPK